jgi:tRNA nucleotidyltransferase/poly(A) polymerase
VYLVGGAVRDMALGRATEDFDFVVRGVAPKTLITFLKKHGAVNLVGRTFGVLKFLPKGATGEQFDIALPRTDHALPGGGGYKDFSVQSDPALPIEADLARRDFTVNAIALRIMNHELGSRGTTIVDPFAGLADCKKKILRTVGKPRERFAEDYSRMLRGLRFACQLGFSIEQKTWSAMRSQMKEVNRTRNGEDVVPRDAIGRELVSSFFADPLRAMNLWDTSGAFAVVAPEVLTMKGCMQPRRWHSEGDVWTHTRMALRALMSEKFRRAFPNVERTALLTLAVFLHDIGKPVTQKTPKRDGTDRIRFTGHELEGSKIVHALGQRLRISQFPTEDPRHIDLSTLVWVVRNHMLIHNQTAVQMKATTLEKYFLKDRMRGGLLQALTWADTMGARPRTTVQSLRHLHLLQQRLATLERRYVRMGVATLLNGEEIKALANIPQSTRVGELLELLREEQLQGRVTTKLQARAFVRRLPPSPIRRGLG